MPSAERYPLNCWWVAATGAEVGGKPLPRRLLDRPVVLFRAAGGAVVALEDRCAHRGAPLSSGRVLDGQIACPYHGFRYDGSGRCTHIPTQTHIPAAMAVRSYPTRESGPFVWIWMGDAAAADPALLPPIAWPTDPLAMRLQSYAVKHCSHAAIHENFMDLAHILFLHSATETDWLRYDGSPRHLQSCTSVEESAHALVRTTRQSNADPLPLDARALHLEPGQKVNCHHRVAFLPPGCFYQEEDNELAGARADRSVTYGFRGVHCTTPLSAGVCHWWWLYAYDFGHSLAHEYRARWNGVLKEDTDLLEAMQEAIERDGSLPAPTLVLADQAAARVRGMIGEMMAAAQTGDAPP